MTNNKGGRSDAFLHTLALPALLLTACSPPIPPDKIVSNNPCVDAILAEIAEPDQVGAVSSWSHDAASASAPLAWARQYPALGASAEEVIAARPRLALIGSFGNVEPLAKAGVAYEAFTVPVSVAESKAQVRIIARAVGRIGAGEALAAKMDAAIAVRRSARSKTAIIYLSGGFVPGAGTLQDELLARAGYRNAAMTYGLARWEVLPLETLVRNPPDVIFTPVIRGDRALALRHRVLAQLRPTPKLVAFPEKLINCGGPTIIDAMQILRDPKSLQ